MVQTPCWVFETQKRKKERKTLGWYGKLRRAVGWFCRYHWSILINFWNYNSNLSCVPLSWKICCLCWIFVNYCQPKKRPTIWIWVQSLENLVIATPNTDFWYHRTVQSFPSPATLCHISVAFELWTIFDSTCLNAIVILFCFYWTMATWKVCHWLMLLLL